MNKLTNKCYIGETKQEDPKKRFDQHLRLFKNGKGCPALRDAVLKYGAENFTFSIIIVCFDVDLFRYEKEYIKKYNSMVPNGYNILEGGQEGGGFKGKKHTEETKKKIVEYNIKRFSDPKIREESSARVSKYFKNTLNRIKQSEAVRSSEKHRLAVKEGRVGNKIATNTETRNIINKKISNGLINYYKSNKDTKHTINIESHRATMARVNGKPVIQYDISGKMLNRFDSRMEAGRSIGVKHTSSIGFALSGKYKSAYGFIWKYEGSRD